MWKNITGTLISEIVIIFFGIANSVIINRGLGPEGKGSFAYILLIAGTAAMMLELGISTGISYFSGSRSGSSKNSLKTFSVLMVIIWFIISCVAVAVMYFTFSSKTVPLIIIGVFLIQISQKFVLGNLLGRAKITFYNMFRIIPLIIELTGLIILIMSGIKLSPVNASLIYGLSVLVPFLVSFAMIFPFKWELPSKSDFADMWSYSFYVYLANLMSFLNYRIDMFFIKFFLPIEYLGWYSVSVFFIEKARIFSVSTSLINFAYKINDKTRSAFPFTVRAVNSTGLALSLLIAVLGYPVILFLYSKSFAPAYVPLLILTPAILANGFAKMIASELSADRIVRFQLFSSFVSIITNIILNIILIPLMGISGAALASFVSYTLNAVILYIYFAKHYGNIRLSEYLLLNREDIRRILFKMKSFRNR